MTDLQIRDLDPADLDAALRVRGLSFGPLAGANVESWHTMQRTAIAERRLLGAYFDDELAGLARINTFRQWWHGQDLPMAGAAGVVVAPEHRGRGVAAALMTQVAVQARDLGYSISALYPATVPVYRAVGWELAGRQYRVSVPGDALRTLARGIGPQTRVRPARPGDGRAVFDTINALHRAHRDAGPLSYSAEQWDEWLTDEPDSAVYLADDGVVAYDWDGDRVLHVSHLGAASEQTARALWAIVGSGSSVAKTVTAHLAPDDPLPWLVPDLGLTSPREIWWMLRVLDPAAAFAGRGYHEGASVDAAFVLTDPQLPDLDGRWRLRIADGAGSFVRADTTAAVGGGRASGRPEAGAAVDGGERAYEVGPRGLAALFAGTRLSVLRRTGVVSGGTTESDHALDAALGATPFLLDYF